MGVGRTWHLEDSDIEGSCFDCLMSALSCGKVILLML